jgi:hypothetical protein
MSEIQMIYPPYIGFSRMREDLPPLGSIAICRADSVAVLTGEFRPLLRLAPWCIPCLITTAATTEPNVLTAIHELPGHLAFVPEPSRPELLSSQVVAAAGSRQLPNGLRLADYVMRRTGRLEMREDLIALFSADGLSPIELPPQRTLRNRLRRFGIFTAHCWRTIAMLCRLAVKISPEPVELLAYRAGVEARTLRTWIRRYLNLSLQDYRGRLGWEWVMEAALQTGGYLPPGVPTVMINPAPRPILAPVRSRLRVRRRRLYDPA